MASSNVETALNEVVKAQELVTKAVPKASNHIVWTPEMIQFLTIAVLIFTFLSLVMCSILLYKKDARSAQILKVFGIIIIVAMSSILLIIGYSNEQLTPIVGLFGAIAGYLLGKDTAVGEKDGGSKTG